MPSHHLGLPPQALDGRRSAAYGRWLAERAPWLCSRLIRVPSAFIARTSYPLYLTHNVVLGFALRQFGRELTPLYTTCLVLGCEAVAYAFYWAFDRHYRKVAHAVRDALAPQREPARARA